jgi:hypothetical protein
LKVIREAAAVDPAFAATAEAVTERRRADRAAAAKRLAGADGLTISLEEAFGTLYVLCRPDVLRT